MMGYRLAFPLRVLMTAFLLSPFAFAESAPAPPVTETAAPAEPVRQVGGNVLAPVLIHSVEAEYSDEARKARAHGKVVIGMVVDTAGMPTGVHVIKGFGMGLDEKAVEAIRGYRFKPATANGVAVPVEVHVEVNFKVCRFRLFCGTTGVSDNAH